MAEFVGDWLRLPARQHRGYRASFESLDELSIRSRGSSRLMNVTGRIFRLRARGIDG